MSLVPPAPAIGASRWAVACATCALLAACAVPAPQGGSAPAPAPRSDPAPVMAPAPAPAPVEPAPSPAVQTASVQRLVAGAIELLEQGNEEQASADLQRALQLDPQHRLAQTLLRQISADPVAVLGRESFRYTVQPGESLSRIAQRFLGDVHLFYILARYNDIKVPRQLAGGQTIRVPGRAPVPGSAPPAAAAPVAPAPAPAPAPAAAAPTPAPAPSAAPTDRNAAIARATRAARAAFARQDLDTAIKQWDLVLELDPQNTTARLERQRAVELKDRLSKVR